MDYYTKLNKNPYEDLSWNIPEQKQGILYIYGGNSQSFNTEIRVAEKAAKDYPLKEIKNIFPASLQKNLPPVDNFIFMPATESGSLAKSEELINSINIADFNIFLGDFSKNSITIDAITNACTKVEKPTIIARDSVDLITENNIEELLQNDNNIIFATTAQLQKIFHAVYYPKIITLSQPIMQIIEALHKFTISYTSTLVIFNNGQLLVAKDGQVFGIPLELTKYSPLTLWSGEILTKIAIYNIYNPNNLLKATISAIF